MKRYQRSGRRILSSSAAIVAVALLGVCALWVAGARGDGWFARSLRSPLTIRAGVVCLVSVVLLYVVGGVLLHLARGRGRADGKAGTAAIEMVLLFPIALCIILVMIQSMLVVTGNIVVHYAAYAAARSAAVQVPERVSYEEPRNVVLDPENSAKFHRVRSAAVGVMTAVSAGEAGAGGSGGSGGAVLLQEGLDRFFASYDRATPRWVATVLAAKYEYAWDYTEVTLRPPADGEKYADHEDLSVGVRHMLYLSVPYAKRIFGGEMPAGDGDYATEAFATYTLTNQGVEDEIDVEVFPRYVGRGEE